ncbi:GerAB/ArcD/ProY family transporter [Paenibacillus glycinis]|uniref:Endospore germination permease n=1 Tax=Paenibacillus glycinis TaxID=2697035 RepID=A0ABW9XR48_9BACL|nr:endospore germination permease [Paenibacillus glycinis]NBD25026.1 endospore germination permease [Paenibacillus glycinis]
MKLTGIQVVWIIATAELVMEVWLRISPAIEIAEQDAWMSMLLAGLIGIVLTFLAVRVSMLHPGQTLVKYSQKLLGKGFGRAIVLPYFAAWYMLSIDVLRSFADFIHLILLDQTPVWLIELLMVALMAYITFAGGITSIGRFCEIAGPVTVITMFFTFILNAGNVDWSQLTPVFNDIGWKQVAKASVAPGSFFGETFMLLSVIAFMNKPEKAMSKSMIGLFITIVGVFAATSMVLLVFGSHLSAGFKFPYFMIVRSISILNFIQNVDIFVIYIWIFGVFAKLSLYLFLTSYEMSNWFNVKDWRKMILFGAPLIFISAIMVPNQTWIVMFQKLWQDAIIPFCGIGVPLLLWILSAARKKSVQA